MPRGPEKDSYQAVIKPRVAAAINLIKKESPIKPGDKPTSRLSAVYTVLPVFLNMLDKLLPILKDIVFADYDPPSPPAYKNYYYLMLGIQDYLKKHPVKNMATLISLAKKAKGLYKAFNACNSNERNAALAALTPNGTLASDASATTKALYQALLTFDLQSFFIHQPVTAEFTVTGTTTQPSGLYSITALLQALMPNVSNEKDPIGLLATLINYLYEPYTDFMDPTDSLIMDKLPSKNDAEAYPAVAAAYLAEIESAYQDEPSTVDFAAPAITPVASGPTLYDFLAQQSFPMVAPPNEILATKSDLISQYFKISNPGEKDQALTPLMEKIRTQGITFHQEEWRRAVNAFNASTQTPSDETAFNIANARYEAEQALYDAAETFYNAKAFYQSDRSADDKQIFSAAIESYHQATQNIAIKMIIARIDNVYGEDIRDPLLNALATQALQIDLGYFTTRETRAMTNYQNSSYDANYKPIAKQAKDELKATTTIKAAAKKFSFSDKTESDKKEFAAALKVYAGVMGVKSYFVTDPKLKYYNDRVNHQHAATSVGMSEEKRKTALSEFFGQPVPENCTALDANTVLLENQQLHFAQYLAAALQKANQNYQASFNNAGKMHGAYHNAPGQKRGNDIAAIAQSFLKISIKTPNEVKAFLQTVIDHLEGKNYNIYLLRQTRVRPHSFDTFFLTELKQVLASIPVQHTRLNNAIAAYHQQVTGQALTGTHITVDSPASDEAREQSKQQLISALKDLVSATPVSLVAAQSSTVAAAAKL